MYAVETKHEIFCDMSHRLIKCNLTVSLNAQVHGGCQEDVLLRAVEEVGPKCGLGARAGRLRRVRREDPHVSIWIHKVGRGKQTKAKW